VIICRYSQNIHIMSLLKIVLENFYLSSTPNHGSTTGYIGKFTISTKAEVACLSKTEPV
jgi:hypothetical protein